MAAQAQHQPSPEALAKWAKWTQPQPVWFVTPELGKWNIDLGIPQRTLHAIILINIMGIAKISNEDSQAGRRRSTSFGMSSAVQSMGSTTPIFQIE